MSPQPAVFYDSIYEALREVVRVVGGPKSTGQRLWPGKSVQEAQTRLLNCLDHNRAEKLSPEDVVLLLKLGRRAGCHVAMHFLADDCGYARPAPIEPEDERARLQREFVDAVHALRGIEERLARVPAATLSLAK